MFARRFFSCLVISRTGVPAASLRSDASSTLRIADAPPTVATRVPRPVWLRTDGAGLGLYRGGSIKPERRVNHDELQRTLGGPVVFGAPLRRGPRSWFRISTEGHLWCAECTRTFPNGLSRQLEHGAACAYADCDAPMDTRIHFWSDVRALHPNYPEHPNMAVQYVCPPWSQPYKYPGSTTRRLTSRS